MTGHLFQEICCPICGSEHHSIVYRSRYGDLRESDLRAMYSASSNHVLLDQVVRCLECDLVFVNPRLNSEILTESYASAVDPTFVAQNHERIATFRSSLEHICRQFHITPGPSMRVLDVGCAGGAFPKAAKDLGFSAVGLEPSAWLADFGRSNYGIEVKQGLLARGIFQPASFDIVTMWDVIEHVPDPGDTLSIIRELLKPGGLLVVNYPDFGSIAARLMGRRWPFLLSVHLFYYTRQTMRRQLSAAGFQVLHMEPHWQKLKFGYVWTRAASYIPLLKLATPLFRGRLGAWPCTYNLGQTLVIAGLAT